MGKRPRELFYMHAETETFWFDEADAWRNCVNGEEGTPDMWQNKE